MPRRRNPFRKRAVLARLLSLPSSAERGYVRDLRRILKAYAESFQRELEGLVQSTARADARSDMKISEVERKLLPGLRTVTAPAFDRMARTLRNSNARAMRLVGISPSEVGISPLMATARDINIGLVENAGRAYAEQVREIFDDPEVFGLRVEELKSLLLERAEVSASRAELIARDQTLKLNGQMTQMRQQNAGVQSYTWSTSLDERVRDTHEALEGEVFSWLSPPAVGHPGQDFQCRCVPLPNLPDLEEE